MYIYIYLRRSCVLCFAAVDFDCRLCGRSVCRELSVTADTSGSGPWVTNRCRNDVAILGDRKRGLVSVKLARFIAGNHGELFRCIYWNLYRHRFAYTAHHRVRVYYMCNTYNKYELYYSLSSFYYSNGTSS